jgi:hypothetical protein
MNRILRILVVGLISSLTATSARLLAQDPVGDWFKGAANTVSQGVNTATQSVIHVTGNAADTIAKSFQPGGAVAKPFQSGGVVAKPFETAGKAVNKAETVVATKIVQTVVAGIDLDRDIRNVINTIKAAIEPIKKTVNKFPQDFPSIANDMKQLAGNANANFTQAANNIKMQFDQSNSALLTNIKATEQKYQANVGAALARIQNKDMSAVRDVVSNTIAGATSIYGASIKGAQDFAQSLAIANTLVTDSLNAAMSDLYNARWRDPLNDSFDITDQLVTITKSLVKLLDTINEDVIKNLTEQAKAYHDVNQVSSDIHNVINDIQTVTSGLRTAIRK